MSTCAPGPAPTLHASVSPSASSPQLSPPVSYLAASTSPHQQHPSSDNPLQPIERRPVSQTQKKAAIRAILPTPFTSAQTANLAVWEDKAKFVYVLIAPPATTPAGRPGTDMVLTCPEDGTFYILTHPQHCTSLPVGTSMFIIPDDQAATRYKPWAEATNNRLTGRVVSKSSSIQLIEAQQQTQPMTTAADRFYGKLHGRVERFDEDQVVISLLGGHRIYVERARVTTSLNLLMLGMMIHFRTFIVRSNFQKKNTMKIAIYDVGIDLHVNYAYENHAISSMALRTIRERDHIDLYVGGTDPMRLPLPAISLLTLCSAGSLTEHTLSSLIHRAPDLLRKGIDDEELRRRYVALAAKIRNKTPINVLVNGMQWFEKKDWIDFVNRSLAGMPGVAIGAIFLYTHLQHDTTTTNIYTTNPGLVPPPLQTVDRHLTSIHLMVEQADSPPPLPALGCTVSPPPLRKDALLLFTTALQSTHRVITYNGSSFGGPTPTRDELLPPGLGGEPGLILCFESENVDAATQMANLITTIHTSIQAQHMARRHDQFRYFLFYYVGGSQLKDGTDANTYMESLFSSVAVRINTGTDSHAFSAMTRNQFEGHTPGGLTVMLGNGYVQTLARLRIDFGAHAVLPIGGGEIRFFPQDTTLGAAALTSYLGTVNATQLREPGLRRHPAPPFSFVIDHAGDDSNILAVPGGVRATPARNGESWVRLSNTPVVDRPRAGLYVTGIPTGYSPATVVKLLHTLKITEGTLRLGFWWSPSPYVAGAPRSLQLPHSSLPEIDAGNLPPPLLVIRLPSLCA